jgi:putative toxin-antitoxin system antitoxin component (TIGR02293 family)
MTLVKFIVNPGLPSSTEVTTATGSARKLAARANPVAAPGPRAVPVGSGATGRPPAAAIGSPEERLYTLSRGYLGGSRFSHQPVSSRSDVHSALVSGVPYGALIHLISQAKGVSEADIAKVLGISTRTLRRQSESPDKAMPADLASKAWLFAETLAKATDVFGGKEQAEAWMSKAAMGLDGQRPIDLLQTVQGAELVNDFLTRLEYGVYS